MATDSFAFVASALTQHVSVYMHLSYGTDVASFASVCVSYASTTLALITP